MANDRNKFRQINRIPFVMVDRNIIELSTKDEFFTTMCRTLGLEETDGCSRQSTSTISIVVSWIFYIVAFILLIWLGAFVVAFFRGRLRKQMNK